MMSVLIGQDKLRFYSTIDWQQESDRFRKADLFYPHYYSSQNFHGIEGGYLNCVAAITYDAVTAFASPPSETWIRQQLISAIEGQPTRILDLGCGTGSTTLMLKQAFGQATVMGIDLSPYMLVVAEKKAQQAGLNIQWQHGLAEDTGLEEASFDLAILLGRSIRAEIFGYDRKDKTRMLTLVPRYRFANAPTGFQEMWVKPSLVGERFGERSESTASNRELLYF